MFSVIRAGLCGLVIMGGVPAPALAQGSETASPLQARAERLLALRARQGLPLAARLAFEQRLQTCASDDAACALMLADLEQAAPDADAVSEGWAPAGLARAATPRATDTQAPVVQMLTATPQEVDIDAGQTSVRVDFEVSDEGGSGLDLILLDLEHVSDRNAPILRGPVFTPEGDHVSDYGTIRLNTGVLAGTYRVRLAVMDGAGNANDLDQSAPLVVIKNSASDDQAPVLDFLSLSPDPLVLDGEEGVLNVTYDVRDPGSSGLEYLSLGLRQVGVPTHMGAVAGVYVPLNGVSEARGRAQITVSEHTPPGEYYLSVLARDEAGNLFFLNNVDVEDFRRVTLVNDQADLLAPVINRLTVTPEAVNNSDSGFTLTLTYDLVDEGGSGLRDMLISLSSEDPSQSQQIYSPPLVRFDGDASASGAFDWSLPANLPTGPYHLTVRLLDNVLNQTGGGRVIGLATTPYLWINEPGTRGFGPFPDVVAPDGAGRDVFRLSGVESGPPSAIEIAFRDPEIYGFEGAFSDCALSINPDRHSGGEYLIHAGDIAACGAFGSADLVFRVTPQPGDLDQDITLRRFRVSETGKLTDLNFDRIPTRNWTADPEKAVFGPFEWTEAGSGVRTHHFRLSGLTRFIPQNFEVAIANASADGFTGTYDDCVLPIELSRVTEGVYTFNSDDLAAACGAFGRADIRFRSTPLSDTRDPVTLTRIVTTASGSITDFSFDNLTDNPIQPVALAEGRARIEAGPFEWTGDATASTQNLFRISGITSLPDQIEIAIANAAASGYAGDYADCNLTIRPQRAGANDYLISASDFTDCGAFGRADIRFRITAPQEALADGVRVRRIATGARGDLTDFNFDHDHAPLPQVQNGFYGESQVEFGPFEWTGDSLAGTQNVFRITGLNGMPTRIEAALANATSGDFANTYNDCVLTVRANRSSEGDYVITSDDLADCGAFSRADIRFRVFAYSENMTGPVQMRRFAITRSGGLTDFGFDNQ